MLFRNVQLAIIRQLSGCWLCGNKLCDWKSVTDAKSNFYTNKHAEFKPKFVINTKFRTIRSSKQYSIDDAIDLTKYSWFNCAVNYFVALIDICSNFCCNVGPNSANSSGSSSNNYPVFRRGVIINYHYYNY